MKIKKYTYRLPDVLLANNLDNIDSIAIHHWEHPTMGIDEVADCHIDENGWDWIGYGYAVMFDGTVYECRGYENVNAAVKGENTHVVSIGFQGDYNNKRNVSMSSEQFNSGVELIRYLKNKLPNISIIDGHNHWNNTECPGKYFPLQYMIRESTEIESLRTTEHWAQGSFDYLKSKGIIVNETRFDSEMSRGECFALLAQVVALMQNKRDIKKESLN